MTIGLEKFTYMRGLHSLGNGAYAWLQPDGSWGWSNAGLIVDSGQSLLVDTLFDVTLTRDMLNTMRRAEPKAAEKINTLINTHANADHTNGNECVPEAEIIASNATARQMAADPPARLAAMQANAGSMGLPGKFFQEVFAPFDFAGVTGAMPTRTFDNCLSLQVGGKQVELLMVGPAHTAGDTLVLVPGDKLLFTGDILFIDGTPIMWDGPVSNWISACESILAMDVETIVPGHGPITDKRGARAVKAYLEYVSREARQRFDAGMSARDAAHDIALGDYDSWGDAERIVVNVASLYREFASDKTPANVLELFGLMAELYFARKKRTG